jgi:hypothetical protein
VKKKSKLEKKKNKQNQTKKKPLQIKLFFFFFFTRSVFFLSQFTPMSDSESVHLLTPQRGVPPEPQDPFDFNCPPYEDLAEAADREYPEE